MFVPYAVNGENYKYKNILYLVAISRWNNLPKGEIQERQNAFDER